MSVYRVLQNKGSIEIQIPDSFGKWGNPTTLAEYHSRNPQIDGPKMSRTIREHLSKPGATLQNYPW